MKQIIGTLTLTFCVLLPLILFYKNSSWQKNKIWFNIVPLSFLWFFTYSFFHELSHMIGVLLVGGKIIDYQLVPRFWEGDFTTGYINPDIKTGFQEFIVRLSPYVRDLVILILGFVILNLKRIRNLFVVGLVFTFFILSSLYDIITNYLGYVIDNDGDFNGLSKLIGGALTNLIGISLSIFAIIITLIITKMYKSYSLKAPQ